jgi:hypothetical protein
MADELLLACQRWGSRRLVLLSVEQPTAPTSESDATPLLLTWRDITPQTQDERVRAIGSGRYALAPGRVFVVRTSW